MITFEHHAPSLGASLIAEDNDTLLTFRGIPYASIDKRWTHSTVRSSLKTPFDATKFGSRCPQSDGLVLVSGGVNDPVPNDDEFECLNLNICAPKSALLSTASRVPVMVWIHGGAFLYGANSVGRYRMQAFCRHAAAVGKPIVLVQINYRLGVLGFASSSDLEEEQGSLAGNYGFMDQRHALQWVNAHIGDFGGDANRITAFGVSAGSASVHFHIVSGDPLFDRGIMMSGAAGTLGPLPKDLYQREWLKLGRVLGLEPDASPAERLKRLREASCQELVSNYSTSALGPVADGELLANDWKFSGAAPLSTTRCKEIILGDTNVEALILDSVPQRISPSDFTAMVDAAFGPDAEAMRLAFGFTTKDQPFEDYRKAMRLLLGSLMFQFSNLGIARSSLDSVEEARNIFMYHWEEPSPYPGPTYGMSYHGLCALSVYLNQLDLVPEAMRKTSLFAASTLISFAHGEEPWEPFGAAERFMRFGPDGMSTVMSFAEDETRTYQPVAFVEAHFERLNDFVRGILYA